MSNSAQNHFNGLYIHVPFCQRKCFYCSFVVAVGHENKMDEYVHCLECEAKRYQGVKIDSIYFGGGTPTLLSEAQLDRIGRMIADEFQLPNKKFEWTIEANPEGLSVEKIDLLKRIGVNRFSLGIQSLNDRYLKYLGRNHDAQSAAETFQRLRSQGASNVSVDLMFGFPDQTVDELKEDIARMAELGSEHVSLYSLTIEEKTKFHTRGIKLPDDHYQAELYSVVVDELHRLGFVQYEISNFAKPGFESEHNINYWTSGDYIGLGVGAHSHQSGRRFWNGSNVFEYLKKIQAGESPMDGEERLTLRQRLGEALVFGLRMNQGVDVESLQVKYQSILDQHQQHKLQQYLSQGLLYREGQFLCATDRGRLVLEEMAVDLV